MTTNPTPAELRAMSEAEVTQEDREAAAEDEQLVDKVALGDGVRKAIVSGMADALLGGQDVVDCIARAVIPIVLEQCAGEYICKCGLRVEPHRCRDTQGDF